MSKVFEISYEQKGTSVNTNELGMREMQAKVYAKRTKQHLLVKAPPASGKSRALMFVALDKIKNQGLKKAIIAVPEKSIGKSFRSTELKKFGYYWDWVVKDENNLTTSGTAKSKVQKFIDFMQSTDPSDDILIATHATLRFASEQLDASDFDDCLLAIDEFHHVSQDDNSVLGEVLRDVLRNSTAHIFAMTGSYFRGDSIPILDTQDEQLFDRVTYTYYEQLEGYKYLKSFAMAYKFYRGQYFEALEELVPEFIDKKTIIHIPNVNSVESTRDKYGEVDKILDLLGTYLEKDEHGIIYLKTKTGRILKIADLVTEEGRDGVAGYLSKMDKVEDLDMIIALGMAKEGFDWPYAEYALTIGYRSSLTEIVQIIGRVTRDSFNKSEAVFTNLIAEPDVESDEVQYSVNNIMKAITASLLMENVLAPSFKFKPKDRDDQKASGADIYIKGLKEPSTERSKQIIENDMVELKASILQDDVVQAAISAGADTKLINKQLIPRVITTSYPDLTQEEVDEVRQHVVVDLNLSNAKKDPENKQLLKMADKFINIDDLSIDLIDQVNPFQSAYEVISRDVDSKTLQLIERAFDAKKYEFTNDELRMLYPQIKAFKAEFGRLPKKDSKDIGEQRLYYALVTLARLRQEKSS
ncbi:DNA helicase, restriction/modification system component YeeB [Streptococcus infantarius subsp. infantarius]|uniref:DEAD/DEAH box helicase n=1 Tax=Streptococcus infantarius TaxID=102684 RepID=UPI00208ED429|nr:DEAD/DEAH box helicase [Streptococcus infantarius]MCO4495259.1 DNA helicase, restriction/modification system component YeeB [Streptococcus infantarius subsp. infantarius]MCO4504673.1 DNA helicase, restriction/modification system component YeeB [Streptococcus infantarius subsp. infantarius]MCO4505832.1 DNA helicase, restriction/modification system component YeeB [Streptococcus infantarius subsp. infantarius]